MENTYTINGGREGSSYILDLFPKHPSLKRMLQRFMIHFNKALQVERTEMFQPNGDRIVTSYTNESRAPIDPGTFNFTPPPGTNVTTPLGR